MYQMTLWPKKFAEKLNIVVLVKRHVKTHKTAHVVLFSRRDRYPASHVGATPEGRAWLIRR